MAELTKIAWWQWIPFFRWRFVIIVEAADEIPLRLPRNGVVLVGSRERPKWVAFDCPCRSGHRIMVSADSGQAPHWTISESGHLTLSPSIDYYGDNRRCHYFIRSGRIKWV